MADNKIELTIAGLSIVVSTPEDAAFTKALSEEVDGDIRAIMRVNEGASVTSAALLCAIDYLYNTKRAEKSSGNMRNQIKDYLAEAAAAKLECEEEQRRALDLAAEIQTLRTQLTRLAVDSDNSITDKMKSQLTATTNELATMRSRVNELIVQNKSLSDKANAMSGLIAQRDEELARAGDENTMLKTQLASRDGTVARQAQTIDELSNENRTVKEEVARLNSELDTLENLILEEERRAREIGELDRLAAKAGAPEQSAQTGFAPCGADGWLALTDERAEQSAEIPSGGAEGGDAEPGLLIGEGAADAEPAEEAAEESSFTLEIEPDGAHEPAGAEEPVEPGRRERASLLDPVPDDDGEPRRRLFDYEASLADEDYEQLDVAMIAEVSPEEEEAAERANDELDEEPDDDPDDEFEDEPEEEPVEEHDDELDDDDDYQRPSEPDYTLRTDDLPHSLGEAARREAADPFAADEPDIIEQLDDPFAVEHRREADEIVARGADEHVAEERTVRVERSFDDDDEPQKPDLSWTLNI